MKDMVIKTLDFLASLLIVISLVVWVIFTLFGEGYFGFLVGLGIFIGSCFTCGFWMALSKIIENQEQMLVINRRLLQSIGNYDGSLLASMIQVPSSPTETDPVKPIVTGAWIEK